MDGAPILIESSCINKLPVSQHKRKGGCIKNKLFDTLFLYIAIESAKIIKRPIFGDFPKIFDSRGV